MLANHLTLSSSSSPSGFAVNLQVILVNPRAQFKRRGSQPGMQESDFLKQITKVTELEPKADNCTRVSNQVLLYNFRPHQIQMLSLFFNNSADYVSAQKGLFRPKQALS